jgi:hypothetical protein
MENSNETKAAPVIEINSPIIGFHLGEPKRGSKQIKIEQINENLTRPEILIGSTYKVKTPSAAHSLYVTINDIVLNPGTDHEQRHPFEIFINSKSTENAHWIVALTRIMSAVFRKGGDITFLVEELCNVYDPKGGYFKGGKMMPSEVAEIGEIVERHLISLGMLATKELSPEQQTFVDSKLEEYKERTGVKVEADKPIPGALLCTVCNVQAVIRLDGCNTCTSCGDSKCG